MKSKLTIVVIILVVLIGIGIAAVVKFAKSSLNTPVPTPTPLPEAVQLTPDQAPKVSLTFTADAHYVTVNITNLHAAALEYDLIYNAVVKNNQINTGVNASAKIAGQSTYSQQQLLGSESSGHFTYHTNITGATMDLTLRDSAGRSIFQATYPFTVTAGATTPLTASQ